MIEFLINYRMHILFVLLFISGLIFLVINEKNNIKEWLLYAVIQAEKELGSKTGKIKLRQVYDEFIITFSIVSKLIPFNVFSKLVDMALIEMKKILNTNINCRLYVKGEE